MMQDDPVITPHVALAHFASHLATAIREASTAIRTQRIASSRYQKARSMSERIAKGERAQPDLQPGDERLVDQALLDVQALSDAMRHLSWLAVDEPSERRKALDFHRKVIEVLALRFAGDRAARYRFDATFLSRCLAALEA